jgi:hypothetical protein
MFAGNGECEDGCVVDWDDKGLLKGAGEDWRCGREEIQGQKGT